VLGLTCRAIANREEDLIERSVGAGVLCVVIAARFPLEQRMCQAVYDADGSWRAVQRRAGRTRAFPKQLSLLRFFDAAVLASVAPGAVAASFD